jgi:L-rhamnonate dehydratase
MLKCSNNLFGNNSNGLIGIGVSTGGEAVAFLIEMHLAMFVEGQNVRDRTHIWDQMWRASIHYSRKGLAVHAISAIDLALWDLYGKTLNEPVYNLVVNGDNLTASRRWSGVEMGYGFATF